MEYTGGSEDRVAGVDLGPGVGNEWLVIIGPVDKRILPYIPSDLGSCKSD